MNFSTRSSFQACCIGLWTLVCCMTAWASPADVPLHHWSYAAIDRLAAIGLCSGAGLSMRPFTRDWMASKIQEALKTVEAKEVEVSPEQASRIEEDLLRLSYEFASELKALGISGMDADAPRKPGQPFQWKGFLFQTSLVSEKIMTRFERDESTSLLENSEGFRLREGFNGRVQVPSWMSAGDWFAVTLDPSLRGQKNDKGDLDFEEASVKLAYWNLELKGGDLNFWWGPGYRGNFLLTDNTRPLQAFSLRTREAFQLPWKFKKLGDWQAQLMGAQLEENRNPSHTLLTGLRLEWLPISRVLLGASHTILFGGKGEANGFRDFVNALDPTQGGGEHERADHLFGGDVRFFFPEPARWIKLGSGLELYGEFFGEDTTGFYIPRFVSNLGGVLITDLFTYPGLDLRFEAARTDAIAYEHHVYTSGYRFKDEFIGHHLGDDSDDLFLRLTQAFFFQEKRFEAGLQFDRERQGISGSPLSFGEVPYTKNEVQVDLTCELSKQVDVTAVYQFEDVNNFLGSSGVDSHNHIVSLRASLRF